MKNTKSKTVTAAAPSAPVKLEKGFRRMKPSMVTKIASMGGKAVAKQRGSAWMKSLGAKGGRNSHRNTNAKG